MPRGGGQSYHQWQIGPENATIMGVHVLSEVQPQEKHQQHNTQMPASRVQRFARRQKNTCSHGKREGEGDAAVVRPRKPPLRDEEGEGDGGGGGGIHRDDRTIWEGDFAE